MLTITRYFLFICILVPIEVTLNAATIFVTNLLDNGGPGSLRTTIEQASSGDTIQFSIAGTITLDETRGALVVNKQLTIDGQNKIIIDGADQITTCFHITGASAHNTIITNITLQNMNGHDSTGSATETELDAYGILIDNNAIDCSVTHTTIRHIHSGIAKEAAGIRSIVMTGTIAHNIIVAISSEDNPDGPSGAVFGIAIAELNGMGTHNTVTDLTSGTSTGISGSVIGISIENSSTVTLSHNTLSAFISGTSLEENSGTSLEENSGAVTGISCSTIQGDCTDNTFYDAISGAAPNNTGAITGIAIVDMVGPCSENNIYQLTSGSGTNSGIVTGIELATIQGNCDQNTVHTLQSGNADNLIGSIRGISVTNTIHGNMTRNLLTNFKGGNRPTNPDFGSSIAGIGILTITGDCSHNTITNCTLGNATAGGTFNGIFILSIQGNCSYNTIQKVTTYTTTEEQSAIGLTIRFLNGNCYNNRISDIAVLLANNGAIPEPALFGGIQNASVQGSHTIACNTIKNVTSPTGLVFGLRVDDADQSNITHNTVKSIKSTRNPAYGLLLGDPGFIANPSITNSLIAFNTLHDIQGGTTSGFGVSLIGAHSTGNELLNNSIVDINGKALKIVSNGAPVDGTVLLTSVRCNPNCSLTIRGQLLPSPHLSATKFLLQFFASPHKVPSETDTLIGEYVHDITQGTTFEASLVPFDTTQVGHYLTATATALVEAPNHNLNTSEVSNAIALCTTQTSHLCPCPPPGKPPVACPVICSSVNKVLDA